MTAQPNIVRDLESEILSEIASGYAPRIAQVLAAVIARGASKDEAIEALWRLIESERASVVWMPLAGHGFKPHVRIGPPVEFEDNSPHDHEATK